MINKWNTFSYTAPAELAYEVNSAYISGGNLSLQNNGGIRVSKLFSPLSSSIEYVERSVVASNISNGVYTPSVANPAFIMRVNPQQTGPSEWTFQLSLNGLYTYNFTIDWGDGNIEVVNNSIPTYPNVIHLYGTSGNKIISITENVVGGFASIRTEASWASRTLEIINWGTNRWSSFEMAFNYCSNLVITATDGANIVTTNNVSFYEAFRGCTSLTSFPMLNTSNVNDFTGAWYNCTGLTSFPALNMANGYNFINTWRGCSNLASFPMINVGLGQYFDATWMGCTSLNVFPTLLFTTMSSGENCFNGCTLDTVSYSDILISLSVVNSQTTCTFHGGNSKYNSSAVAARTFLTDGQMRLWTITDGGLE